MSVQVNIPKVLKSACVATALLVGTSASASVQVSLQNSGNVFAGTDYTSKFTLTYDAPGTTDDKVVGNVAAGGFALKAAGMGNFVAWCLDIYHYLSLPGTYDVTTTPFAGAPLGATRAGNIEALFETALPTFGFPDGKNSAAVQLALWELTYETDGSFDLNAGAFSATGTNRRGNVADAIGQANTFLANLGGTRLQNYDLTFLESASSQDLVTASPSLDIVSQVPLPAGLALLLTGLAPFGLAIHRRRRAI